VKLCKGSVTHGTGCGICPSCEVEKEKLHAQKPVSFLVKEDDLDHWAAIADDPQFQEIIRLARHGLVSERHSNAITDALKLALGEMPVAKISRFEKALDAIRRLKIEQA
jgi:hypothetical protein